MPVAQSRRTFIAAISQGASLLLTSSGVGCSAVSAKTPRRYRSANLSDRMQRAYDLRCEAAFFQKSRPLPSDVTNDDDRRYATSFASYSKVLPHDETGEVNQSAYRAMVKAIESGVPSDFQAIPLGGTVKLVNPQASYSFGLQGADSYHVDLPAAPAFASAESAADMAEVYWQAILRDVPFSQYAAAPEALAAAADLSRFADFRGPRTSGFVTPAVLFRGSTPGDLVGPYVSQFLYGRIPQGVYSLDQRFRMPLKGVDYLTSHADWIASQRGAEPLVDPSLESVSRFIRTGRDLSRFVHRDYTFQAFLNAAHILLSAQDAYLVPTPYSPRACAYSPKHPFPTTEDGFSTFGAAQILDAVTSVANLALRASWRQKWTLHRRPRPEVFAQRFDRVVHHGASYPIHSDLMRSSLRDHFASENLLLPVAYPEGAPAHPSYPAGHAAVAGACATVLKAFFREDVEFQAPVRPADDGLTVIPYEGPRLHVGNELNKLASNIALGRDFAGIHFRSDCSAGLSLGERVACAYLADVRRCLTEEFDGFTLTTFSGDIVSL